MRGEDKIAEDLFRFSCTYTIHYTLYTIHHTPFSVLYTILDNLVRSDLKAYKLIGILPFFLHPKQATTPAEKAKNKANHRIWQE